MTLENQQFIKSAEAAALEVLLHNSKGPFLDLPRTAGWGYPEPYTRDLLISVLGIAVTNNAELLQSVRHVLLMLAKNQSKRGHIPSLVHDKEDRGASDTTPLFLIAVGIFRKAAKEPHFLENSIKKALLWMEYQSPSDHYMVSQLPTSDWRDEQWVLGHGLFVNTLVHTYLKLFGNTESAEKLRQEMERPTFTSNRISNQSQEGLTIDHQPYYALWSYKVYSSERFDLLGNSIAILSGIASPSRAKAIIDWVETSCSSMRKTKELSIGLSPNFFPFIYPGDSDWFPRYTDFNQPGNYHNGGIWPFISGFYIAALVASKNYGLAEKKLLTLTKLIKTGRNKELEFGFNEWYKAQDGKPMGQDWQTWSASNYLYAARCVAEKRTPFFDSIRK
ncbi:glycoside hydrolase 100 family protein [Allomuricauda taeanensis]|uniref:glycoside hydrolase 100 family protein n=1 Tax=Flagellimonas taeanensis TaxID=1005926 RepID=UPI002E7B6E6F|nr:glycoside hydrolase 100 family protein [Allomuricauda taeanensis]MEE1963616.1 glycoside hydrolase 100 family protein [Allomuricauda taeanensis]